MLSKHQLLGWTVLGLIGMILSLPSAAWAAPVGAPAVAEQAQGCSAQYCLLVAAKKPKAKYSTRRRSPRVSRFDCFDRCSAEFKSCLGGEHCRPNEICQNGDPPGGRPYEECLRAYNDCNASCKPPPPRR